MSDATCDTSALITDPHSVEPDYLIDLQTRYLICVPSTSAEYPERLAALDHFETTFVRQFRQPASDNTPDGEAWRLYSRQVRADGTNLELFVGYREKAPSMTVETPRLQIGTVNAELKTQAALIAQKRSD
jgi:hypothetical protein